MPDYLTKRNGFWQFVRRVPLEFAELDSRGIIKHSTKIEVAKDRRGIAAAKIAEQMNRDLLAYWLALSEGKAEEAAERYAKTRRQARIFGFRHLDSPKLTKRSAGRKTRLSLKLSEVFPKFEELTRNKVKEKRPIHLKRWRNGYLLAVTGFINVVGDKALEDISHGDILDYVEWLEYRVETGEIVAKTANKHIGHNSAMIKEVNREYGIGLHDLFAGMRINRGPKSSTET
jgi:hypothetical protein